MVPDRQYHANGRPRAAVPGTPSRKDKHRETSALQDPGLKDYVRTCSPPFESSIPFICPSKIARLCVVMIPYGDSVHKC